MSEPVLDLAEELDSPNVRANVAVAGWEDAVDRVGALLVDAGSAEPRYVEAMKDGFREYGPYAVLAPGIAMPHARPEQGVVRPGVALITLREAVEFGSPENDPVDLVVAFAAVDKRAHVTALQQLAILLSNASAVEDIRAADSDAELVRCLREALQGEGHDDR